MEFGGFMNRLRTAESTLIAIVLVLISTGSAVAADLTPEYNTQSVTQLIDELVNVDAETSGLHGTAFFNDFIAEDAPAKFEGGVLGSVAPKRFPQMVELVRRGAGSLPLLIEHLDDRRPTKLTVGGMLESPGGFFTFQYFGDEYDPKVKSSMRREFDPFPTKSFNGKYTVKVGDVCYALIGQIVNRKLSAVRYQPSAILVVNSPIEAPILIAEVKKDWGEIGYDGLLASLMADARAGISTALQRLRFYYPEEYRKLGSDVR
jgi:hypothetical protein